MYNKKEFPISKYKSGLLIYIFFNFGENLWSSFNQYTSLFTGNKSGLWWECLTNLIYIFISFRVWLASSYKLLWLRIRPLLSEVSKSGPSSQDRSQVFSSIRVFQSQSRIRHTILLSKTKMNKSGQSFPLPLFQKPCNFHQTLRGTFPHPPCVVTLGNINIIRTFHYKG